MPYAVRFLTYLARATCHEEGNLPICVVGADSSFMYVENGALPLLPRSELSFFTISSSSCQDPIGGRALMV